MRAVFPNVGDSIFLCLPRLYFYLRRDSLFVIQKAKPLHMNTVVNIAPQGVVFPWQSDRYACRIFRKILILVFFRVFWKVLCRNEILVFLGLLVFHIE